MNREEHIKRHIELHAKFDELLADYLDHNKKSIAEISVMQLLTWSHTQTINPTEHEVQ